MRSASTGAAPSSEASQALGLLLFDEIAEAMAAESVLIDHGLKVAMVAPPFDLRVGCDLALELPAEEISQGITHLIAGEVRVRAWTVSADGGERLVNVATTVDYGSWLMVRVGNMKLTVKKDDGLIVNISGGGCPDIPFLNIELVGLRLDQAPRPRELGATICGLMLDSAFVEACHLLGAKR
ncbi:MAG: DUF3343 domain-containing protein [Actinobacteria bacterium]|nr:DUF3343 domain-containing protein [Actinomycetota bacterium]MCL5887886.1 DUF3343 domain-containing protein [Actinomycetota bacterium]